MRMRRVESGEGPVLLGGELGFQGEGLGFSPSALSKVER